MELAILGGGVAGLSTAIALKQAGYDVCVYERNDSISQVGAGMVCWPNAAFVLEQLGILEPLKDLGHNLEHMKRFNSAGQLLGALDILQLNSLMGYPSFSILRRTLMQILTEKVLELGISIHYQYGVTSIIEIQSGRVEVKFNNGHTIEPDVVIGAEGRMNSIARKFVHGDNKPIYQGFVNWIGVYEGKELEFNDASVMDYWGCGERFGLVPVAGNKAYWAGAASVEQVGPKHPDRYKQELMSVFEHWPQPIGEVISQTPQQKIHKIFVHDHNPIQLWHKCNLILIGDAAHSPLPTSGQGACQALEDAWHLSRCLSENEQLCNAFEQFTLLRFNKTTGITVSGRRLAAQIFSRDKAFCQQRDLSSIQTDFGTRVADMAKGWGSGLPL